MRQPRLHWTSFDLLPVWEVTIVPEDLWYHASLEADTGNSDRWISKGTSWPAANKRARLPAAVGGKPRKHPRGEPAGIKVCEDDALQRFSASVGTFAGLASSKK